MNKTKNLRSNKKQLGQFMTPQEVRGDIKKW
jgi:hypothetical protein